MEIEKFKVEFLEEVIEFIEGLDDKARIKIIYNITKAKFSNDSELFKKLTENIWEFRTLFKKSHYRIFAFWDKTDSSATIVIACHGILKKTDKTPTKEIEKAEQVRINYFKNKSGKK